MLEHGGNLGRAAAQYDIALADWLDLSTGINPRTYPLPDIPATLWQRLPLEDDGLLQAASRYYQTSHVLATAGSQPAIQALPALRAPCRVALCATTYAEHALHWRRHGHHVTLFEQTPSAALLAETDVLVICNPNNPTGLLIPVPTLLEWHAQLAARGGWLVVDEAFMDATPAHSLARQAHLSQLIVLRSLGKFFGLAGARVGFVLAAPPLLDALGELLGPWTLSGPSRLVARTALLDTAWHSNNLALLKQDYERLFTLLCKHGLPPLGSTALFQWVPTPQALSWQRHLATQGIWVRLFSEVPALRFGLPPADGWDRLELALSGFND